MSTTAVTQCSIDALYDGIDLDCNVSRFEQYKLIFLKINIFSFFVRLRFEVVENTLINDCLKPIDIILEKAQLQADDIKLVIIVSFLSIQFL